MYIFLILILAVILLWPYIVRWLQQRMLRHTEDVLRRMAGAPTRKEEEKMRRRAKSQSRNYDSDSNTYQRPYSHPSSPSGTQMMREVAEDVEFVEIKEYSEDTDTHYSDGHRERRHYRESQVEDVQFKETKTEV